MNYKVSWRDALVDVTNTQNPDNVLGALRPSADQSKTLIYLRTTASFNVGQAGTLDISDPSGGSVLQSTQIQQPLGGVASQVMQPQQYGWFFRRGLGIQALVNANTPAGTLLGTSTTPGSFGPANQLDGDTIALVVANSTGAAANRTINIG